VRLLVRLLPADAVTPRRGLAPAVVCGSLAGAAVVAQAALSSHAIAAAFLERRTLGALLPVLAALAALAGLRAGLVWLQERLAQRFASRVGEAVRDRLARRLLALGPGYATRERAGELVHTLTGGVEAVEPYVAQYLPQAALAGLVPALVLAAVALGDPLSALLLLATFPLVPLFMWLVGQAAQARARRQWAVLARLAARFHDALAGLATLLAFGRADDELRVLAHANERHRALTMEVLRLAFVSALALEALATLGTAVVAVEVGLRLLYARIAFRQALFVLMLAPEFYRPLRALGAAYHAGMAGREAAARMAAILEAEAPLAAPAVVTASEPSPRPSPDRRPPRIRFESVAFAYERSGPRALDGLSLEVAAGTTLALVGPTGAGKSTVARLLLRFVEPDAGTIFVDETRLGGLPAGDWRRRVAWVPQQPRLFHATLGENLRLASPEAGPEQLERALELAGLTALVRELPCGLDTPVGEGGERLAGGEAQRVALARAFLKDAPVLILDEPTAQLDLASEASVIEAIARLRRGRTVLLVAHRLTTVAAADRVAFVSGGRVVEEGAPASLAASGTVYPRLLAAWSGGTS
jgi:ATP-binding cassette, subfamily C, bacterial CydD